MYMFSVSEKFKKHLSYGCELHDGYLAIKANCFEEEDKRIEDLLDRHQAKIKRQVWQSKINFYICYDYEPFTTELFLHVFYIVGDQKYLEWLKGKVEDYFKNRNHLEKCYLRLTEFPTNTVEEKKS